MGPSTLSGYSNLIISVTSYERETLEASYTPVGELASDESKGLGDPFCNPIDVSF